MSNKQAPVKFDDASREQLRAVLEELLGIGARDGSIDEREVHDALKSAFVSPPNYAVTVTVVLKIDRSTLTTEEDVREWLDEEVSPRHPCRIAAMDWSDVIKDASITVEPAK